MGHQQSHCGWPCCPLEAPTPGACAPCPLPIRGTPQASVPSPLVSRPPYRARLLCAPTGSPQPSAVVSQKSDCPPALSSGTAELQEEMASVKGPGRPC